MAAEEAALDEAPPPARRRWRVRKYLLAALLAIVALIGLGVVLLNSPIGHRYVAEQIGKLAPASGLGIKIGRIEGSLYGGAELHDVVLSDPNGPFLRVPEVEIEWRPFNWFRTGLDVRKLVLRRGTLLRGPELRPGDPAAPILPNFDIRIDRFEIDNLTVAPGIIDGRQRVDFAGKVDIRKGRALVRAGGSISGDRVALLLDAEPDGNRFDLELDYAARKDGLLAELTGAEDATRIRVAGDGTWANWRGALLADYGRERVAALRLSARSGRYNVLGQVWPGELLTGLPARAVGEALDVGASGTLANSVLRGKATLIGQGFKAQGDGAVDLANNLFQGFKLKLGLRDPDLLDGYRLDGAGIAATLDGKFRDLTIAHGLVVGRAVSGDVRVENLVQAGVASFDGATWTLPLEARAQRIVTGTPTVDPRLVNVRLGGTVRMTGPRVSSENLALVAPGLAARLVLRGDTKSGAFALAGPVAARRFELADLGLLDADAQIVLRLGGGQPWRVAANLSGRMVRVDNSTLTSLAGNNIRFAAALTTGGDRPIAFERATLNASKLSLQVAGRVSGSTTTLSGGGRHVDYGPFTVEAQLAADGPRATLVFASPYPAAGLKDVRVALAPIKDGFRIETSGGSTLGPFEGTLGLFARAGGPTRIEIDRLTVWKTDVAGSLLLGDRGVDGTLTLAGGGVNGSIRLEPRGGGQGIQATIVARNARFGGDEPLTIADATIEANGLIAEGSTTIQASLNGQGIAWGSLYLGQLNARADLKNGSGRITAVMAGRRSGRVNLRLVADVAPNRYAVLVGGDYAGQKISMPRRAVLTRTDDGWRLAPTQVNFAGGRMIASGLLGGDATEVQLALDEMPLALADVFGLGLGLGGKASGLVDITQPRGSAPTGEIRVKIDDLSRSGLVLTSRPIDLALVGRLTPSSLALRAVANEGGQIRGRLQAQIAGLPASGALMNRLEAGRLTAQLRYDGPADALWRLAAIEAFDLTGPLKVAADIGGSLSNPTIRGSLASDALRLQSALIGTDVHQITARGFFAGSRLTLTRFSGRANNGTVSGSGTVDLSDLARRGPAIDLKLAARNARLMNRPGMSATVTGPLRIVSDGVGGTIAGRLALDAATWQLGGASGAASLPNIPTREINAPGDIARLRARGQPWRLLIDAAGANRIQVRGLGMDSEWGANLRIRGTADNPAIFGQADLVRGGYEFAGTRFELIRGRINFDGGSPPDPRLDILAESQITGLTARVAVRGNGSRPEITFSSTPALPEEELLARLLFGSSITDISAPEALQLGAALASLRGGGGGLDPINKLRSAIGLDRLRIIAADPALDRGTGIAAGKYLGDKFYVEIITDGRGYNATQIEYRVSSWLSLLASVSTIGRQSVNVKISKDY